MGAGRLIRAINRGYDVRPLGVRPGIAALISSMIAVDPDRRPASAFAVFEAACKEEFAFFEGVDAVQVPVELAELGVKRFPFGPEVAWLKRENAKLKRESARVVGLLAENAELRAEVKQVRRALAEAEFVRASKAALEAEVAALKATEGQDPRQVSSEKANGKRRCRRSSRRCMRRARGGDLEGQACLHVTVAAGRARAAGGSDLVLRTAGRS
jgi:hypothetical protein